MLIFFECKHSKNKSLNSNSPILSDDFEEYYFQGTDIDGRYIIYNGDACVKEYNVGDVIFTPLNRTIDNYFEFNRYILNNKK